MGPSSQDSEGSSQSVLSQSEPTLSPTRVSLAPNSVASIWRAVSHSSPNPSCPPHLLPLIGGIFNASISDEHIPDEWEFYEDEGETRAGIRF